MAKKVITGIPVSSGIAIGKAFFMNRRLYGAIPRQSIAQDLVESEAERLRQAVDCAISDLVAVREDLPKELSDHALLIDSHITILRDPKLSKSVVKYITTMQINAEWALLKAIKDTEETFAAIKDDYIRERIQDVRLMADRVLSKLMGLSSGLTAIEGRIILLAHDLAPSDTAGLEVDKIMAFSTTEGGKTSHTGILARTLQIPAIVGVSGLEDNITDGEFIIIDALKGRILVEPSEEELAHYTELQNRFETYQKSIHRNCHLPGETIDGFRVAVHSNIELFEEVAAVLDYGGEGIGLFRTEYSYMNRPSLPTEEELYEEYKELAEIMDGKKVTYRTLDLGSDKLLSQHAQISERNPALGLRSIRFCLQHKDMFKTQLRAILRAAVHGNCAMMYPMISGLRELREANKVLFEVKQDLRRDGLHFAENIPVGIMVELPSAVMTAELLAREVDFFSIGTNDLIQYSLGIDRTNKDVSYLYQPLHPAVLRSIKMVVDAAHQSGIEVSLCGEVASDPFCVPILLGMQIDSLSMNPQAIPGIKRIIRQTTMDECKTLLRRILDCRTVMKINRLVMDSIFTRFPEELTFYSSLLDLDDMV
ncbi:phosphoenolpyruvate--protein phosphotransferase [Desulfobaculum bizertense]|uniref:Phosphoenolpyruvate-protein phosphotransferase n=1 Tax=Desulfobaculum bizertense DSM 18034 TaxID=1121442 RepID=A0A1T4VI38_9BACT|nr:phosphoenolpyruvate--protein phosphotransferase [Desulfobaculum bizertense]UIJ37883.1 phosphoenolpyruvate--protein phosphotransferase [Desulfobaculum bizertense]SKA64583.1 phosphotransferase system, enzyme I, PtsI [Desulfobaculum bizertense DSM 18034]